MGQRDEDFSDIWARIRVRVLGSAANPRERSLWAMCWIAEFGRVWVFEVELRMRKRVLGSGGCEGKKVKGKGDWSVTVRGFEGSEEG